MGIERLAREPGRVMIVAHKIAEHLGFTWGEAGWILEDNAAMNAGLEKMNFTVYKTYRLYDRPL